MTVPYALRLLCVCLAAFFLIHLAVGLAVSWAAPAAVRVAERMRARRAAAFVLAVRLCPAIFAVLIVVALCLPSFLRFETAGSAEDVSVACLAAALMGLALWIVSIARAGRALNGSLRYLRFCRSVGKESALPGEQSPVWIISAPAPLIALAGLVRPRLVISREVIGALSSDQLSAALRHEHAHLESRDNWKRLLVLLAPGLIPGRADFGALDRAWTRFTEWAADDRAAAGDPQRSVALAAALVRVARLGNTHIAPPLATSLLSDGADLSTRVDRLLNNQAASGGSMLAPVVGTFCALAALGGLIATLPLASVHEVMERLIH
jgi:hypothetical protein